jgi:hypothetical protein
VTSFLEQKLVITNEIDQFSKGMKLLTPLFKFMSTTYISTDESYLHALALFKTNVREFYAFGKENFRVKVMSLFTFIVSATTYLKLRRLTIPGTSWE